MQRRDAIRLLTLAPLGLALVRTAQAKTDAVADFQQRYGTLKSVDLVFASQRISGRLRARLGGLYCIEAGDRQFVCDGHSVWNVQTSTKTVVIDRYVPSNELSVDCIFFVLLNVYVPSVKKQGKQTVLRLTPPGADAKIVGVDYADVYLDLKGAITRIDVNEHGQTTEWTITKLTRNPKLSDAIFTVASPKGWNVVDLR